MTFPFTTLPGLALYAGSAYRNPVALGYKRNGRWHRISSEVFLDSVRHAGECLMRMGLRPGDRVGIAANSTPFWIMADLAVLGAGGVTVPLFPNAASDILRHQIRDSGMRFLFAGDGGLRDLLIPLCGPEVEEVLVLTPRLVHNPGAPRQGSPAPPGDWDARAAVVRPEDTATLIYTSGSTGMPKGVELTHANIVSQVRSAERLFPLDARLDSALSFLPLAHIFERMVSYFYIASGVSIHFAEDPKLAGENLREIRPTLLTAVPRFLEKAHDRVRESTEERGGVLGALARSALRRAFERGEHAPASWKDRIYEALVYRRIRGRMGGRLRLVISGSAPLDARLCRFFLNIGVPVYEGYGLTESSPVLTVNYPGHRKAGTVGRAYPGVELRVEPDGEVLARGPNVMKGYYGQPEATREVLDAEGWLHTGDLGRLDGDGYLNIIGRKKELFKTASGKYVAPLPIEQALVAHPLIEGAVVIADGRRFVTAVLFPDLAAVMALREILSADGADGGGVSLRSRPVLERFEAAVASVNEGLNAWERIQRFCIADAPPSIESGELTPTLKLRRHAVEARYAQKIEAMYAEKG